MMGRTYFFSYFLGVFLPLFYVSSRHLGFVAYGSSQRDWIFAGVRNHWQQKALAAHLARRAVISFSYEF